MLCIVEKKYVLSVYDLKGSKLGRNTFRNDEFPTPEQMKKKTMKDLDFNRFEIKFHVNEKDAV